MFSTIVVPVDPSEPEFSKLSLEAASDFAKRYGSTVHLVCVLQVLPGLVAEYLPPDYEKQAVDSTRAKLKELAGTLGIPADKAVVSVRVGGVYHEVLDEVEEIKADLIVMSSHRPAMSTYLLGSNAAKIVRHAPCSVLVLRPQD